MRRLLLCLVAAAALQGCPNETEAPLALFAASATTGEAPLEVRFYDLSLPGSAEILGWAWDFGDGTTSALANPSHVYDAAGVYDVSLTVTTIAGANTRSLAGLVRVTEPGGEEGEPEGEGEGQGEEGEPEGSVEGADEGEREGESDPPFVVVTSPENQAGNVQVFSNIRIFFNEAMDPDTINDVNVSIEPAVDFLITYGAGVAILDPVNDLLFDEEYAVTVSTDVRDQAGNRLAETYRFAFMTLPPPDTIPLGRAVTDAVFVSNAPVVVYTSQGERTVNFVNLETGLQIRQYTLTNPPQAIRQKGGIVYVADRIGSVFIYLGLTGDELGVFGIPTQPFDIELDDDLRIYISERRNIDISIDVYDAGTLEKLATTTGFFEQLALRFSPDEQDLWAVSSNISPRSLLRYSHPDTGAPVLLDQFRQDDFWQVNRWFEFDPSGSFIITDRGDRVDVFRSVSSVIVAAGQKLTESNLLDVHFDAPRGFLATVEADGLHRYDLDTFQRTGFQPLAAPATGIIGQSLDGETLYVLYAPASSPGAGELRKYPLANLR